MGQPHSKGYIAATYEDLPDLTPFLTALDYIKGGGQADIRKARFQRKNENTILVIKQLRRTDDAVKLAHFEMKTWHKAGGHENVVQLLGKFFDTRGFPSMVAEFCEQGDLLSYTFSVARFNYKDLLCDVLKGLQHVHGMDLAHGDLKPENIVLTVQSRRLTAKICDFGSARDLLSSNRCSLEYACTPLYRSPELSIEEAAHLFPSFAADVWAFGCVAFVVLCKKMPYHWVKNRWTIDLFIASRKPPHSEDDKWPETSLRHLVQSCWRDADTRPSANALLRRLTSAPPDYSNKPPSHAHVYDTQPPAYSLNPNPTAGLKDASTPSSDKPVGHPSRSPLNFSFGRWNRRTARRSRSRSSSPVNAQPTVISPLETGEGRSHGWWRLGVGRRHGPNSSPTGEPECCMIEPHLLEEPAETISMGMNGSSHTSEAPAPQIIQIREPGQQYPGHHPIFERSSRDHNAPQLLTRPTHRPHLTVSIPSQPVDPNLNQNSRRREPVVISSPSACGAPSRALSHLTEESEQLYASDSPRVHVPAEDRYSRSTPPAFLSRRVAVAKMARISSLRSVSSCSSTSEHPPPITCSLPPDATYPHMSASNRSSYEYLERGVENHRDCPQVDELGTVRPRRHSDIPSLNRSAEHSVISDLSAYHHRVQAAPSVDRRSRSRSRSPAIIRIGSSRCHRSRSQSRSRSRSRSHSPARMIHTEPPGTRRRSRSVSSIVCRWPRSPSPPTPRRSRSRSSEEADARRRSERPSRNHSQPSAQIIQRRHGQRAPQRSPIRTVDLSPQRPRPTTPVLREACLSRRVAQDNFRCSVSGCGSTFTRHISLREHIRSHHGAQDPEYETVSPQVTHAPGRYPSTDRNPHVIRVTVPSRLTESPQVIRVTSPRAEFPTRSPFETNDTSAGGRERDIVLNINITIDSDNLTHRTPQEIRNVVRIPRSMVDPGRYTRSTPQTTFSPFTHQHGSSDERPLPPMRTGYLSSQTSSSSDVSCHLPIPYLPETITSPLNTLQPNENREELEFPHQESYTHIVSTKVDGKMVVKKSLRQLDHRLVFDSNGVYLNYGQDMFRVKHEHIVEIHGVLHEPGQNEPSLTMDYYPTDLLSYRSSMDYQSQLRAFCQILEGLSALHTSEPPIAHQCLKASNIMIDTNGSVKLSLMNSEPYLAFPSYPSTTRSYSSNWPKVSRWWSPDVYNDKTMLATPQNDIWAFGCVVLEVITGLVPYSSFEEDSDLVQHMLAGRAPDSDLRRMPRLKLWKDVRRCWSSPRPATGYMLSVLCDYLSREVMGDTPDLTGKVARAANPFVRGHSADLYSGIYNDRRNSATQNSVVVKLVRSEYTTHKTAFLLWLGGCVQNREHLVHPNICQLLGVMYSARLGPLLIYERCAGGNLLEYLEAKKGTLEFQTKFQLLSGVLGALVHLHENQNIAWGDLHPANILLDNHGSPKLCGLGPRLSLHHEAASKSDIGVIRYFGPERYLAEAILPDKATDIWAFGCLIVKVLTGYEPYRESQTVYGIVRAVTSGQRPYERSDCEHQPLWYMASSCWVEGLLQRPTIGSLARRMISIGN